MSGPATVDRLLTRMRERGDFPAMAATVGQISHLTSSEDTSTSVLADTVLQDYGLAQKLLRLVNTAAFAQHSQVTTISRAVLLLGFERVRTVATGLILFEHLQAQAQRPAVIETLAKSLYSAILARAIAEGTQLADPEEAFLSALFHNLGRILGALYLPDEVDIINATDGDPDVAVHSVLGMSYSALGAAVVPTLKLPTKLAQSLNRLTGPRAQRPLTDAEKLACVATLVNGITDTLASRGTTREKREAISDLVRSYGPHFAAIEPTISALIGGAVGKLHRQAAAINLPISATSFLAALDDWHVASLLPEPGPDVVAGASSAERLVEAPGTSDESDDVPDHVLTRGLHEITSLLVTDFSLDDVLRVILETIYRALGVRQSHAVFLLKDALHPIARFRFGLGRSSSEMRSWLEVPLTEADDLFTIALRQHRDVVIKDTSADDAVRLLPEWYRRHVTDRRYLVLLPLVVDHKALGLFYIDGEESSAHLLTPAVVNYLKVLRGQAVVAIHHHRATRPLARRT